jgi:hypothetical protein
LILPSPLLQKRRLGGTEAIQEIDKNQDAATCKPKVAELMSAATDAKIALVDAREGVASKAKEIDRPNGGATVSAWMYNHGGEFPLRKGTKWKTHGNAILHRAPNLNE